MMQPLQGSFVALVTPMNADGSLDYVSLKELVDDILERQEDLKEFLKLNLTMRQLKNKINCYAQ